ncbi:hormonally up-regulated neu tumor-associated kinase homolog A-like [Melitaea cinxia]|uniref:hormonally up-regulated neu tumor-associated kinase homolog A-like n=1 Tax=Melitaea cinxia TaxID=113334 RepID=UPI001E274289|nr:hormonally up-regulated neu tumor-associated kinase homolog A-like [Melitaea cinxia]
MASMTRSKGQVYSVGNYLMTGKVLGKGHFARVEEATHRIIGKKVAIKIVDLTCIKEEYARRNLHREPRVMSKLRHPCIAALYETMMHGPRLYVVMEAACGGDLCSHVLQARGSARGLPEPKARALAAQLVSAVRHMHSRGVVHRDLKMENIMLDSTKQYIKIVDFGLSNVWRAGGALATPCGSLEYAAPELFEDGRRYGPEVDLWSIGVIVYGMVTGGLPFSATGGGGAGVGAVEGGSRSHLRAAIARGMTRRQRSALACVSTECKNFIQQLLEPKVDLRMKIEEAARHRWVKKPGMRMRTHPLAAVDSKANREIYRQISELCGQTFMDVVAHIKADPFGAIAGMYNIKTHLHQLQSTSIADLLWSANPQEPRPQTPPEYRAKYERIARAEVSNSMTESKKSPRLMRSFGVYGLKKPVFKVYENGDGLDRRLPSIDEHSNLEVTKNSWRIRNTSGKVGLDEPMRLNSCPNRMSDVKRDCFYKRAGDGFQSWRSNVTSPTTRILLQNAATTIKRASLGNIVSPHSSTNSHCKSERAMPVGWYPTRPVSKETQSRLRRTALMK